MGKYRGYHYDKNKNNSSQINEIKYYVKNSNYKKALSLLDDFLYSHPYDDCMTAYKATVLSKLQRNEEAKEVLENLLKNGHIKSEINRLYVLGRYARVLSKLDETQNAIYYFEKIIEESNELELFNRYELSLLYQKEGREKDAIDILTIDGFNNTYLNTKRANIYLFQKKYKNVFAEFKKNNENIYNRAVYDNIDNKFLEQEKNYIIGHALYKLKRYDDALTYLYNVQTIKTTSIYFHAYIDIANIYIAKRRNEDAIKICEELLKLSFNDTINDIVKDVLASAHFFKQDYDKAHEYVKNSSIDDEKVNIRMGRIELSKGNFIEAEKLLDTLNENDINGSFSEFYFKILVKFRLGKYDEVLRIIDCLEENSEIIEKNKYKIDRIKLLIYVRQGKNIPNDYLSYSERQIISYDKEAAIEHVISHHIDNIKISKFQSVEQIRKIFDEIGEQLTEDNIIYNTCYDEYIVKYNNVGNNVDDGNINQLRVVTLPGTKDIITMYPFDGSDSLILLDEYDDIKEKPKVKRLSQIEKFNKRYNKA